jgi:hypothetical protein
MAPGLIPAILEAIVKVTPEALDAIERWVHHEKAKRVNEVRPGESFSQQEIDELKGRPR